MTKLCLNSYGLIEQVYIRRGESSSSHRFAHSNRLTELLTDYDALVHLFTKMTNNGLFPVRKWGSPSDVSFFALNMAAMEQSALHSTTGPSFQAVWARIIDELPPSIRLSVISSLFSSLDFSELGSNASIKERRMVREKSLILRHILQSSIADGQILSVVITAVTKDTWSIAIPRMLTCCLYLCDTKDTKGEFVCLCVSG